MIKNSRHPKELQLSELPPLLQKKWGNFLDNLEKLDSAVVAYSGGVDSSFLAFAASKILINKMTAVTVITAAEPSDLLIDAMDFAATHGINHITLDANLMKNQDFRSNPPDRCYFCKRVILETLWQFARDNHIQVVLEGQNIDDLEDYRPGRKAIEATGTLSPLAVNGFTKEEIRFLSKILGLSTWNQPSSPCLATRIPYGTPITIEALNKINLGEVFLKRLGLQNVRVRYYNEMARIEVEPGQFSIILENRIELVEFFKQIGFLQVSLDLQGFRSGSMNEGVSL